MKKLVLLFIPLLIACEDKNTPVINPWSPNDIDVTNPSYKPIKIGNHTWIKEDSYRNSLYIHDPDCKCIQAKIDSAIEKYEAKHNKSLQ